MNVEKVRRATFNAYIEFSFVCRELNKIVSSSIPDLLIKSYSNVGKDVLVKDFQQLIVTITKLNVYMGIMLTDPAYCESEIRSTIGILKGLASILPGEANHLNELKLRIHNSVEWLMEASNEFSKSMITKSKPKKHRRVDAIKSDDISLDV